MSAGVPEVAIRWILSAPVTNNTDLAVLSNVCRSWRSLIQDWVLQQARESLEEPKDKRKKLLLLPSMVRYLLKHERSTNHEVESYCLSWFHPLGIDFQRVPLHEEDTEPESEDENSLFPKPRHVPSENNGDSQYSMSPQTFAPSGQLAYAGSEEEAAAGSRRRGLTPTGAAARNLSAARLRFLEATPDEYVNCMTQWNGYQEAHEVLQPFGYAPHFVKQVIKKATERTQEMSTPEKGPKQTADSKKYQTFAVRGSTIARPEGYCLCWDNEEGMSFEAFKEQQKQRDYFRATAYNILQYEWKQQIRKRRQRKRELQREVLPKVLYSAPTKGNDASEGLQLGIRQPCVQFLNVDSSHAVRLFTPLFKPGPVPTPITVFCIGIATEDGCFFSGLNDKFEFGHLHPESQTDDLIERSPICLSTDSRDIAALTAKLPQQHQNSIRESDDDDKDEENVDRQESYNSDDTSCDGSGEGGGSRSWKCTCPFAGLENNSSADDDDPMDSGGICRGSRGPGMWHCYTVIADGTSTRIRVDGQDEIIRCAESLPPHMVAYLDGLTIGADHTFDMSLCFGQGSDGEGEGAIAELAAFKCRFETRDLETIEKHLMLKHGIPLPDASKNLALEDGFSRLAHAMLSYAPHHKVFATGETRVPLRYLAKHRLVSWRQTNPVTGEKMWVPRIGSKMTESSSDW